MTGPGMATARRVPRWHSPPWRWRGQIGRIDAKAGLRASRLVCRADRLVDKAAPEEECAEHHGVETSGPSVTLPRIKSGVVTTPGVATMDQERFDRSAQGLATALSRRAVLGGITAGLAGLGWGKAAANHGGGPKPGRCGRGGHPCKWGTQSCSGDCHNGVCTVCPIDRPNLCPATNGCHPACPEGKYFDPGTCTCKCVEQNCCNCTGVFSSFCSNDLGEHACVGTCFEVNNSEPGTSATFGTGIGNGITWVCSGDDCIAACNDNA
jgi:hypothetical protein